MTERQERIWTVIIRLLLVGVVALCGASIRHEVQIGQIQQIVGDRTRDDWLRADMEELKTILRGLDARVRAIEAR